MVFKKEGIGKAILSEGFLTSFIPGIAMSILFGQLMLMAMPLKLAQPSDYASLGTYSKKTLQTQKEKLVVVGKKNRDLKEWNEVDSNIGPVTNLVSGLSVLVVPSLGYLTPTLQKIALACPDVLIIRISSNKEVQVRVSTKNVDIVSQEDEEKIEKELVEQLNQLFGNGVKVMFHYKLPTVGGAPGEYNTLFISLCVQVEHLLELMRALHQNETIEIDQVYDFWNGTS